MNRTIYEKEKKRIADAIAAGVSRREVLGRIRTLRALAPEHATSDADTDWMAVAARTSNFTAKMSRRKAARLARRTAGKSGGSYSDDAAERFSEYLEACGTRDRKLARVRVALISVFAVLAAAAADVLIYSDRSGLMYGAADLSFSADGVTLTVSDALRYNSYPEIDIPPKKAYDVVGVIDRESGELVFGADGVSVRAVREKDCSDFTSMRLEVLYEPHTYTAFVVKEGETAEIEYTVERCPEVAEPQALPGYVFEGWYTDESFTSPFSGRLSDYTDGLLTLYPKYVLGDHLIVWELNGGTLDVDVPEAYTVLDDVILPSARHVSRVGYDFAGWRSSVTGDIVEHFSASAMTDVTFTAVWTPTEYPVEYVGLSDGVNDPSNPVSRTVESADITLRPAVRAGYEFVGWKDESGEYVTVLCGGSVGAARLTAEWKAKKYIIDYDTGGGVNDMRNPSSYDAEELVELAAPTRVGYDFAGWYVGDVPVTVLDALTMGDVTVTAAWTPRDYMLTAVSDGTTEMSVTFGGAYSLGSPYKTGYVFAGWRDSSGADFAATGIYSFAHDTTVVAVFTPATYEIRYDPCGGRMSGDPVQTVTFGEYCALAAAPVRDGYEFTGWYGSRDSDTLYSDGIYDRAENTLLFARYVRVETINVKSGNRYVVSPMFDKVYFVGNYDGKTLLSDVDIVISARYTDLTLHFVNVGFRASAGHAAVYAENGAYDLSLVNTGVSVIVGGNGTDSDSCESAGGDGAPAVRAFALSVSGEDSVSLELRGGDGGDGHKGAEGRQEKTAWLWLTYTHDGGRGTKGGDAGNAVVCSSLVNETDVLFVPGAAGKGGEGGDAGWRSYMFGVWKGSVGEVGEDGDDAEAIRYVVLSCE